MSSVHCVVVWEWQSGGQWLPHTPGVTRTLERAHAKKLTRVVLADADPALKGHYVNLRTLTQCSDTADGGSVECLVRRACYGVASAPGRGVRWEWARFVAAPHPAELLYEPMPMEMQCLVEEAWCAGSETVSSCGWIVHVTRMTARAPTGVRLVRRAPQPPYPLTRSAAEPPPRERHSHDVRRPRIPQQHTGSSVQSLQSVQSVQSMQSVKSVKSLQALQTHACNTAPRRGGARSASPRDRKPGLARQILHNLNIFSHSNKPPPPPAECARVREAAAEPKPEPERGRRHSVDTVSTYLSHESKDSLQQGSVGELLNCSAGSDDVFETPPLPPPPPPPAPPTPPATSLDAESAARVCSWVRMEPCPQWGSVCPACLRDLAPPAPAAVALQACQHLLHLHCLQRQLERRRAQGEPLYIECLVCGHVYGRDSSPRAGVGEPAPPHAAGAGDGGAQPPGSMAWSLQPTALPPYPHCSSILITYSFQSGRQGPLHPAPGAPYYAVGFPRHTLLPDTPLGRQVLSLLRSLWASGLLFGVCASQTTGREHVVAWRAPPPPAAPHHYPAHAATADRLLLAARDRLQGLMTPQR